MEAENSQFCVNIYCVMPSQATEATCPKDLFQAHEVCKENGFNVSWIQEEDCIKLKPSREDVFILAEFVGPLFDYLRNFKCTIIGPQCLLVSVQKGEPLPEVPTPVFTVAMKGLVVTTTGCTTQEKKEIQEKVQFMGGVYSSAFVGNVTHLIVKSVADFSLKFKVAITKDIPVMVPKWADAVWSASIKESVHGTDPIFAKYACPPFQGLVVCVSQIPSKEREALKKLIEGNGGQYSGQLEMGKTNVLIATSAEGEKFTYARRWKIRCIKPEWIHASLNKGYAVDPDKYIVEKSSLPPRCSTPEADHSVMKFGNGSVNSTIMNESRIQLVDETASTTLSHDNRHAELIDSLDLALTKKAGPFLDGCKVFLSGFDGNQMEKLRRVLNCAGVARFNTISESLSHVIAGQRVEDHWKQLQQLMHKPHVVTVEWVVQSLRLKRAAPEANYLHSEFKVVDKENVIKKPQRVEDNQEDSQMVQQYLTVDQTDQEESLRPSGIFSGLTFQLVNLDADSNQAIDELIVSNGGRIVLKNAKYIVVEPVIQELPSSKETVNTLWIEDCVDQECLLDVEDFHRPIQIVDLRRLSGCVVSFSGIQGRLREFLDLIVIHMGGRPQETFSRKLMEEKNVYRSTHLVCAKPEGKKYEKALEWGVPAVDSRWLFACAVAKIRPNEADFSPAQQQQQSETPKNPAESVVLRSGKQRREETPTQASQPRPHVLFTPQTPAVDRSTTPMALRTCDTPNFNTPLIRNKPLPTPNSRPALFNMPTPETPYGRLLNTDPSPDTRKLWKHALDNRVRLTPHGDTSRLMENEIEDEPEVEGYFENLRKKLRLDTGAACEAVSEPEERTKDVPPFHNVVAYLHKKIEEQRTELVRAVESLGGKVRFQHCEEVTHFVYQGKLAASKEIKSAKEWHQKFVSPQWILDCEDAQIKLEESQYPPSLNAKMTLSLSYNSQPAPPNKRPATPKIIKKLPEELPKEEMSDIEEEACKELLQLDQVLSRSAEQGPVLKAARAGRTSDHVFVPATQPIDSVPDSQSAPVVWDLHETQKLQTTQPVYRIMFSGMAQADRDTCTSIIENLGGSVLEAMHYDPTCTHLVVAKVGCNEKLLTSIAAGKWILHPEWIGDSDKEGRFLDEQSYEWGNPASAGHLPADCCSEDDMFIASAAHYWRSNRSEGPFHGFKAVLYLREKNASFQRLLEAGGGEVIDQELALTTKKTNLCIVDHREVKKLKLAQFASRGIYCVPLIYLRNVVLAKGELPQWRQSVVQEFVPFLETMP